MSRPTPRAQSAAGDPCHSLGSMDVTALIHLDWCALNANLDRFLTNLERRVQSVAQQLAQLRQWHEAQHVGTVGVREVPVNAALWSALLQTNRHDSRATRQLAERLRHCGSVEQLEEVTPHVAELRALLLALIEEPDGTRVQRKRRDDGP